MFKCIEDSAGTDIETGHALKGTARVSQNRAIRDAVGAVLTNKAVQFGRDPMQMRLALEDGAPPDNTSTNKRPKKEKKEPTEAEKKQKVFDAEMRKILSSTYPFTHIAKHHWEQIRTNPLFHQSAHG